MQVWKSVPACVVVADANWVVWMHRK
jgi:hypothetical protein